MYKISHLLGFYKQEVLKSLTGKHPSQRSIFSKHADLKPETSLIKGLLLQIFSLKIYKIFQNRFFVELLRQVVPIYSLWK